jgi:PAS domain-containing protein
VKEPESKAATAPQNHAALDASQSSAKAPWESKEIFQCISSAAQDAIIMMDGRGNVTFWNEAAERIFG